MSRVLFSLLSVLCTAGAVSADDCTALGGTIVAGECRIAGAVVRSDADNGGPFAIDETLRIMGGGKITVPPAPGGNSLTLNVTGDVIMDLPTVSGGSQIIGDVVNAGGVGATITIAATGNIVLNGNGATGARISSNQSPSCSTGRGGNINLTAGGSVTTKNGSQITSTASCPAGEITITAGLSADIEGLVSSEGTTTVGRGGPITVTAACTLTVGPTGKIRSVGKDPGADLVHLEGGCEVLIQGLVASTGPGHAKPPANRCHFPDRLDKPMNAPACVEVWSGGPLTVDSSSTKNGEINADTGQTGGVNCCAWIDLFASGDIKIVGDTGGPFSVHANQTLGNGFGGHVTIKSTDGSVSAIGRAIQASATAAGGSGGIVMIEAKGSMTLDDAQIFAQGDFAASGGYGTGGMIEARAYTGGVTWKNLAGGLTPTGDVQPTGSTVQSDRRGIITLTSCSAIDTTGALFPAAGTPTTPTSQSGLCPPAEPDAPTLPGYAVLPTCLCSELPDVSITKSTSTPVISAGATASYSIVVSASGPVDATNVTLTDTLPAGLQWTVGGPNALACSPASPVTGGTLLTCAFGTMAPGATRTITLTAVTTGAGCPAINNTATVRADADSEPINNTSGPVKITVNCPDVKVIKTTSTPAITVGATAAYSMTVTALGPGSSNNVVLTDVVPSGHTWTVGGANAEACSPASPVTGGTTLTCSFGTLAQAATRTVTLTAVTTAASCPHINNTATVSAVGDTNGSNNTSGPIKITVNCAADVKVVKTTTTPTITAGGQASYGITVTANGPASSTNVVLTDVLPAGLTWTVGGPDKDACSPGSPVAGGATLTCSFGTMAAQATKSITLTATTSEGNCPHINNTATVSSNVDSSSSNNTSGPVKITVNCVCPEVLFAFSGSTSSTGSAGNIRTFTVDGVSVKVSAFSRTFSSGAWATAYLGVYGPGLGVTDGSESGGSPSHKVDNLGSRNNYVLFEFSSPVTVDRVFLDSVGDDSDISVWIGTKTDPFNNHITLSDAVLTSLGPRADNNTTSSTARWAEINAGQVPGNVLVIAASASDTTPDDDFKISKVDLKCE